MAADIVDTDGSLKRWLLANSNALAQAGLWCEPFKITPTWVHVQTVVNPQGKRLP